jgi:lipopolysaccharide export system protein LptC
MNLGLRRAAVAILLLLAAGTSWWVLHALNTTEHVRRSTAANSQEPDYFIENFRATVMNDIGERRYTLAAQLLQHFPQDQSMRLTEPRLVQFTGGKPMVYARADFGRFNELSKEVTMTGHVKITRKSDSTSGRSSVTTADQLYILLQ